MFRIPFMTVTMKGGWRLCPGRFLNQFASAAGWRGACRTEVPPGLGDSEGRVRNGVVPSFIHSLCCRGETHSIKPHVSFIPRVKRRERSLGARGPKAVPKLVSVLVENSPSSSHGAGKSAWRGGGPGARGGRLLFRAIKAFTMSAGIPS